MLLKGGMIFAQKVIYI